MERPWISNPVNRERIRFLKHAADTQGEAVQFETRMDPGGVVGAEHIHRRQQTRFEVVEGTPSFCVNNRRFTLNPGDTLTIPARTPHYYWNQGPAECHMVIEFSPALKTEEFFRSYFALAQQGKTNLGGVRNVFQRAVLRAAYLNESRPVRSATPVQILLIVLAPIGRLLGYRAVFEPAGDPAPPDATTPRKAA
jgi:mannose-6-phosphate isomerase-like protein (cupin superfamily)